MQVLTHVNKLLCHVMLCYVMLCYVMLCYVMSCYVMLCYVMFCFAIMVAIRLVDDFVRRKISRINQL